MQITVTSGTLANLAPNWPSAIHGNVRGALYWIGVDAKHYAEHPNLMTWDGNTEGPMVFVRVYPDPVDEIAYDGSRILGPVFY